MNPTGKGEGTPIFSFHTCAMSIFRMVFSADPGCDRDMMGEFEAWEVEGVVKEGRLRRKT